MSTMTETNATETKTSSRPICDRYRIRFAKTGLLRWIGHQDLQRLWERLLRRNDLRLTITSGFHPRPRMHFPSALALGVEGLDEVIEVELAQSITVDELRSLLVNDHQPGLAIGEVTLMATNGGNGDGTGDSPGLNKAKHHSSEYQVEIPAEYDLGRIDDTVARARTLDTVSIERKGKTVSVVLAQVFPMIARRDQNLCISQIEIEAASLKIADLLDVLGLDDLLTSGGIIRRTRLYLTDQFT
jgi:radical SAM-linked protein